MLADSASPRHRPRWYRNGIDASNGLGYVLRTANQTLSLNTTAGYDDVTGLGTPTGAFVGLK